MSNHINTGTEADCLTWTAMTPDRLRVSPQCPEQRAEQ